MTSPEPLNILVDLDDVLYSFCATAHAICERAGITNGRQITSWNLGESYGCPEEDVWKVLHSATVTGELYESAPIPGTLSQIRRLRYAGHRVHIVTARGFGEYGELIQAMTREWVSIWNVPLDSLTFAKDKPAAAAELGCTFGLDDAPHNYEALNAADVLTFLMSAPHNQGYEAMRVQSVQEFADIILSATWI